CRDPPPWTPVHPRGRRYNRAFFKEPWGCYLRSDLMPAKKPAPKSAKGKKAVSRPATRKVPVRKPEPARARLVASPPRKGLPPAPKAPVPASPAEESPELKKPRPAAAAPAATAPVPAPTTLA